MQSPEEGGKSSQDEEERGRGGGGGGEQGYTSRSRSTKRERPIWIGAEVSGIVQGIADIRGDGSGALLSPRAIVKGVIDHVELATTASGESTTAITSSVQHDHPVRATVIRRVHSTAWKRAVAVVDLAIVASTNGVIVVEDWVRTSREVKHGGDAIRCAT